MKRSNLPRLLAFMGCGFLLFAVACGGGGGSSNSSTTSSTTPPSSSAGCQSAIVAQSQQVANPVALFPTDNNGVILQLPSVSSNGQTSVSGSLVFGIGTQTNNQLGTASVFTTTSQGLFTTVFNSTSYTNSFIDSGSNGFFFLDANTSGLPACTPTGGFTSSVTSFYCPSSTKSLTATQQGANGTSVPINFKVNNAETLFLSNDGKNAAFNNLAGPNPGSFDWGLPFFFGRNVYTAISGMPQPSGAPAAPYWAHVQNFNSILTQGAPNIAPLTVNSGPTGTYDNGIFTTVTVCIPGTSTCQAISGVLVDTGSSGLRILSSALKGLALPQQTIAGTPLGNCVNFVDGSFLWGAVRLADVTIGGETAGSLPIQVMGDASFSSVPSDCSANSGGTEEDSLQALKANGILGIGLFQHDCGALCSASPSPNQYFACSQ